MLLARPTKKYAKRTFKSARTLEPTHRLRKALVYQARDKLAVAVSAAGV